MECLVIDLTHRAVQGEDQNIAVLLVRPQPCVAPHALRLTGEPLRYWLEDGRSERYGQHSLCGFHT